jgi:two-component system, chemotaxis family, chemotaxis protein CheY
MLKKVLVVDDSALIHQMFKMALSRYKCSIVSAMNGQEGLDQLARNPDVDLILLDINMPVMSGLEFLGKMKEIAAYSAIPIVIQSTEGKEEDTKRGMEMGATAYLTKPIQTAKLHALIEKIVPSSAS